MQRCKYQLEESIFLFDEVNLLIGFTHGSHFSGQNLQN